MGHTFLFTLDDEANGRALHATRGQPAVDLAPEDRGYLISKEAVEDAAGFGGVDQLVIDVARMGDCFFDRGLGDLVEDHAADRHLRLQVFEEVGGDGLTLAVFVGGKVQLGGVLQRTLQLLDHGAAAFGELIRWLERVLHVDRQPLAREVGDVTDRGANVEGGSQVLGDRFRLCRRLDNDEGLRHDFSSLGAETRGCQGYPRKSKCSMALISVASCGE